MKRRLAVLLLVIGAITLTGCEENTELFNVVFNSNGGSSINSITSDGTTILTMPNNPIKEGYTFDGWYCDQSLTNDCSIGVIPINDLTLYANWEVNQYTVEYVDYNGTILQTADYDFGSGLTGITEPNVPSREGYTFDGWDTTVPVIMGVEKVTITTKWVHISINYRIYNDELIITEYTGNSQDIVIPDMINGYPITIIAQDAFKEMNLKSVVLPTSLKTIGEDAFSYNQLTSIIIPEGVIVIEEEAFRSNLLTSIILPSTLTEIGSWAFHNNKLTSIVIPEGATTIGSFAFAANQLTSVIFPSSLITIDEGAFVFNRLTTILIPEGVTTIGSGAFAINEITNVIFPSSLVTLGGSVFAKNLSFNEYIIDEDNISFKYIDNTLFSYDGTIIYDYVLDDLVTNYVVTEGVTIIGESAFAGDSLTSVTLPSSLTTIEDGAFYSNQLTTITIPEGVVLIGDDAFGENQLTNIIILGDNTRFNDIWSYIGFPNVLKPTE